MSQLRIIYDNIADTATSLSASTTSGSLIAAYMQNDTKGKAHRSTGTSVTYTLTWAAARTVGGVLLPATNLTSAATIQVQLFSDTACTVLEADSTALTACPDLDLSVWGFTTLDVNAFAYGGAAKTGVWFHAQPSNIKGCKIDLVDTGNPAGYIDCARLVVGEYWSPVYNAEQGATCAPQDTSKASRADSGDLVNDAGTVHDVMTFKLSLLSESDRAELRAILNNVGTRRPFYVTLFAGAAPTAKERDFSVYGKRDNSPMRIDVMDRYSTQFSVESW